MICREPIKILDHGYLRFVEAWGCGDAGGADERFPGEFESPGTVDFECGIVEAARQSTQGSFRHWEDQDCPTCKGKKKVYVPLPHSDERDLEDCETCGTTGIERGDVRLLTHLYNSKPQHATPFEFAGMTIEVQAPILVYREWHRHRTQSYNEMSARYAPLPNFNYSPQWDNLKERGEKGEKSRNKQEKGTHAWDEEGARTWWESIPALYDLLEYKYQEALKAGVPKELARITIPVGRYSRMRATGNLRNWFAFLTLRSDPAAQYEIRQYALALETIIQTCFPRTYDLFCKRREGAKP